VIQLEFALFHAQTGALASNNEPDYLYESSFNFFIQSLGAPLPTLKLHAGGKLVQEA